MTETIEDTTAEITDAEITDAEELTADLDLELDGAEAVPESEPVPEAVPESEPVPEELPDYEDITAKELAAYLELKLIANTGSKRVLYDRFLAYHAGDEVPEFVPTDGGAEPETHPDAIPEFYIVEDERSYIDVARKFGIENYRELGGLNGVFNSRYELEKGDKVRLSTRAQ